MGLEIKWLWVKAHIGVSGNGTADSLAKVDVALEGPNAHVDFPRTLLRIIWVRRF